MVIPARYTDALATGSVSGRQTSGRWVSADGARAYSMTLYWPEGDAPSEGYALMVLLDGAWVTNVLAQAAPGVAVALVTHVGEAETVKADRAFDFTPPLHDQPQLADPRTPHWRNGGADAFLALLDTVMVPWALAQAAFDPARVAVFGHSYGALCLLRGLYAGALRHVARCVLASPSVWWHDGAVDHAMPGSRVVDAPGPVVLFLAGEHELWHAEAVGPDGTARSRAGGQPTLAPIQHAAVRLVATGGHEVYLAVVPQGTHHSMLAQSLAPAFEFARQPRASLARTWRRVNRWEYSA